MDDLSGAAHALALLRNLGAEQRDLARREAVTVRAGIVAGLSWRAMAGALQVSHRTLHNRYADSGAACVRRNRRVVLEVAA